MRNRNILLFSLISLIAFASCHRQQDSREVYQQIETGAGKNTKAHIYEIDTLKSKISWSYQLDNGVLITGNLRPDLGSVIVENDMITAGFFEADVWKTVLEKQPDVVTFGNLKKALTDSIPVLKTKGRKIRMDISQAGRQIVKSEFNTGVPQPENLNSFALGATLDVADSAIVVNLPISLNINPLQVEIKGLYDLIPSEFGMKKRIIPVTNKAQMNNPLVQVAYTLVFKPLRKATPHP